MKNDVFGQETCFLVTGGAGFIGTGMVEALLQKGYQVRALDNFSVGKRKHIAELQATYPFDFIEGSICDFATCRELI